MEHATGDGWSVGYPADWEVVEVEGAELVAREELRDDGLFRANVNVVVGAREPGEPAQAYAMRQAEETMSVLGAPFLVDCWAGPIDGGLDAEITIAHVLPDGVRVVVVQRHVDRPGVGTFVASATCEGVELQDRLAELLTIVRSLEVGGD